MGITLRFTEKSHSHCGKNGVAVNKIALMRSDPVVESGGKTVPVTYTKRKLLRLLVLNNGRTVSGEAIAELGETGAEYAASKIRDLRNLLKPLKCEGLIQTVDSRGYQVDLTGWVVDALLFKQTITEIGSIREGIAPEVAREAIPKLEAVLKLWSANPAEGLPNENELIVEFERLYSRGHSNLLMARLQSGDADLMREAVITLENKTHAEPDESDWTLLLRAYATLGNIQQTQKTWTRIQQAYGGRPMPSALRNVGVAALNRQPSVLFARVERGGTGDAEPSTVSEVGDGEVSLLDLVKILGITTSSQLKLEGTRVTPIQCIQRTRRRLFFAGILASKWVIDPSVRSAFDDLLTRLDKRKGDVRFLVINPYGKSFKRLHDLRKGNISAESIPHLKRLVAAHPSFSVRAFDSLPAFRIVIIDDDVVTFSPYRHPVEGYKKSGQGWQAPHVILDPLAAYPLAEAFQLLFLETWETATPITKLK